MVARISKEDKIEVSQYILGHVTKEAEVTRIEYEGPTLAVYTKRPEILVEQSGLIAEIVNVIRKRIVVRSDPSVRLAENEAEKKTREIVSPEAEVTHMSHYLHSESKERERILRTVGERIFRPKTYEVGDVRITALGGVQEVGRSAFLLQTRESSVLLDCGTNPGSSRPFEAFPRFDIPTFELDSLDAVVISHAHLDHCGLVPFLYKYGYDGPVYCSAPTSNLMTLLQLDYLDVGAEQ